MICKVCGLPKELCICETIAKEKQKIRISIEKKRYGKIITMVKGLNENNIDIKSLLKKMKSKLACGGTYKNGVIELQGNHKEMVKKILEEEGFSKDSIEIQ